MSHMSKFWSTLKLRDPKEWLLFSLIVKRTHSAAWQHLRTPSRSVSNLHSYWLFVIWVC